VDRTDAQHTQTFYMHARERARAHMCVHECVCVGRGAALLAGRAARAHLRELSDNGDEEVVVLGVPPRPAVHAGPGRAGHDAGRALPDHAGSAARHRLHAAGPARAERRGGMKRVGDGGAGHLRGEGGCCPALALGCCARPTAAAQVHLRNACLRFCHTGPATTNTCRACATSVICLCCVTRSQLLPLLCTLANRLGARQTFAGTRTHTHTHTPPHTRRCTQWKTDHEALACACRALSARGAIQEHSPCKAARSRYKQKANTHERAGGNVGTWLAWPKAGAARSRRTGSGGRLFRRRPCGMCACLRRPLRPPCPLRLLPHGCPRALHAPPLLPCRAARTRRPQSRASAGIHRSGRRGLDTIRSAHRPGCKCTGGPAALQHPANRDPTS